MVPEGTMQFSKGGKLSTALLSYDAYDSQQWLTQQGNPNSVLVIVTNSSDWT